MDILRSSITCSECGKIFHKPTLLSCGQSVCLDHVEHLHEKTYLCKPCGQEHKINRDFLFPNKSLEILISANLPNMHFDSWHKQAHANCSRLADLLEEIETVKNDPMMFVNETVCKFRGQVELIREEIKAIIDAKAAKLIDELDAYERECKAKTETDEFRANVNIIENELTTMRQQLADWQTQINRFDSDRQQLTTICERSSEHLNQMKTKSTSLKNQLLNENLKHYRGQLELFSQDIKLFQDRQLPLDLVKDLNAFCDIFGPLGNSNLIESDSLQSELLNLCEFDAKSKWSLLYRASEHGFEPKDFHAKCDGQANTLTIIRSSYGNIFGGFVDVPWDSSNTYKASENAFIFSLKNDSHTPFKIKVDPASQNAIYCGVYYGPTFGSGHDFYISAQSNTKLISYSKLSNSYKHDNYPFGSWEAQSILAGAPCFKVDEIEVYRLDG